MRCTRCDRLAIPQAVGRTREGVLVFGWCLDCLEAAGCQDVAVADPVRPRRRRARLFATPRAGPRLATVPDVSRRRRIFAVVALMLSLWGIVLMVEGLVIALRARLVSPSPLGNGSPLLIFGGGATSAYGLGLWLWLLRSGRTGRSSHE